MSQWENGRRVFVNGSESEPEDEETPVTENCAECGAKEFCPLPAAVEYRNAAGIEAKPEPEDGGGLGGLGSIMALLGGGHNVQPSGPEDKADGWRDRSSTTFKTDTQDVEELAAATVYLTGLDPADVDRLGLPPELVQAHKDYAAAIQDAAIKARAILTLGMAWTEAGSPRFRLS